MRPTDRRAVRDVCGALILCGAALIGASKLFADGGWLPLAVGSIIVAGALSAALAWWRVPLAVCSLVGVGVLFGGLLLYGSVAGDGGTPIEAAFGGWRGFFTSTLPVTTQSRFVAVIATVAWLSSFAAVQAALRRPTGLVPLGPPALAVCAIALLGGSRLTVSAPGLAVFVALSLLYGLVRTAGAPAGRDAGGARAAGGQRVMNRTLAVLVVAHLAAVVVAGVVLSGAITDLRSSRYEARDHIHVAVSDQRFASPLADFKALITTDKSPAVLTATPRSDVNEIRLRMAVLDHYDGTAWRSSGVYQPASNVLPGPPDKVPRPQGEIAYSIAIGRLQWPFVPTGDGYPLRVDGVSGLTTDPATGVVQRSNASLAGVSYDVVTAVVNPLSPDQLKGASATQDPIPAPVVQLDPGTQLPDDLKQIVKAVQAAGPDPKSRLDALRSRLGSNYGDAAPPGHSLGVLVNFAKGGPGTAEHFASLFALVANEAGLPSRVAVGLVRTGKQAAGSPVSLTTRDYDAWPEVYLQPYGWVPFEVAPAKPPLADTSKTSVPATTSVSSPSTTEQEVATTIPLLPPVDNSSHGVPLPLPSGPWRVPALLLLVVVLCLAGIVVLKRVRTRRRRTRGSPSERVVAGWTEALDRLNERGFRPGHSRTPREVASIAHQKYGPGVGSALDRMGPYVDNAVFGNFELTDEDVGAVWAAVQDVRIQADRQRPIIRRLGSAVDPRTALRAGAPR